VLEKPRTHGNAMEISISMTMMATSMVYKVKIRKIYKRKEKRD